MPKIPMREVPIRGDTIRLGQLLKLAGIVDSGAEAKALLADAERRPAINGEPESRRGRQLHDGDVIAVAGERLRIAGAPVPASRAARTPRPPRPRQPLVIAHRGAWDPAPQNSIAAFERAAALGADGVELDVRRTGDGRLVVVHDSRVGVQSVARLTAAQLRARLAPGQAPELEEVVAALAPTPLLLNVELKEDGLVADTLPLLARHLVSERYIVTSFLDSPLLETRALAPEVRTGLLLAARRPARALERRIERVAPRLLALHTTLARTGLLDLADRRGLPAWVWTANEPRLLRALLADPRVQAVITDRPAEAVALAQHAS
ncbi:MAG TPA: glycerophosphodiester phosphodiesterase family protein [Solirubrobacteraceae bacterium]|nr:glycerophosphodiester phosphodiesterase family protein [Solirubrobacteraceae bacterium]